jgi:phospholipid/cholesterol/gamma-HCH transport system substrate-binding protein
LVNAQTLLAAVNERSYAVGLLLERVSAFSQQVRGFINDNPNLNKVLMQLNTISDVLVARKYDLADTLTSLSKFTASLGEAVASGPYFKVMIVNLLPYQIIQPWVDAAFKKRGIDPEEFWRNSGLPSFRYPDPNGQRQANGAPPPAPTPLEGTPEHPGPAVIAGSPCSYAPGPGNFPTPGNPLPCAQSEDGPFGPNPYGANNYGPPDVLGLPANPNAPPPAPGVPSSAFPGEYAPPVQGVPPAPFAPGNPGARTVPVTPGPSDPYIAPGSLQGDGTSPLPPALVGPTPPPGPGPQVGGGGEPLPGNPPFLPPGSQG